MRHTLSHQISNSFFLMYLKRVKGYLAFIYLIRNQSIGAAKDTLHELFWIFEHMTDWAFAWILEFLHNSPLGGTG